MKDNEKQKRNRKSKNAKKLSTPQNTPNNKNKKSKSILLYIFIALAIASVLTSLFSGQTKDSSIAFSEFINQVEAGKVKSVTIDSTSDTIQGVLSDDTTFKTSSVPYPQLVNKLREASVKINAKPQGSDMFLGILMNSLPFILIIAFWIIIMRQAQGANSQAMSFGKTRAKPWDPTKKQETTFKDIGGCDEAVEELVEIVDFLKSPEKYHNLGAKIPKGVLLMGAPGTGKTLLARAVAGEADVAFFSLSGSDFVEMFVGVGASRVRDLFSQAKKNQPSIIFVDEIDAVGRQRGAGLGGGHDEREQTLNQLLVEMDGFEKNNSVIIIAATNRPDILDPALLRPGRFDRQIMVDKPDIKGRLDILNIHAKDRKFTENIDLDVIARRTPGFTGADLANVINEATLLTARRDMKKIGLIEIEEAIDRVMAGPEKKSKIISEKEKKIIAYHEIGHALVAKMLPDTDPVHKISMLPRGMALGYTLQLPEKDKYLTSKSHLINEIKILLGGRIAEKEIFSEITTGSSNDIKRATEIAHRIVCEYGMSDNLGSRTFGKASEQVFLGREIQDRSKDFSEDTSAQIDKEIHTIFDDCYSSAEKIIKNNKEIMTTLAETLIEKEVINAEEFNKIIES